MKTLTEAQQIQKSYNSSLDSVKLIELLVAGEKTTTAKETVSINVSHLKLMVKKTFWTPEQTLIPLNSAITVGEAWLKL